jgi:hypothetical protein
MTLSALLVLTPALASCGAPGGATLDERVARAEAAAQRAETARRAAEEAAARALLLSVPADDVPPEPEETPTTEPSPELPADQPLPNA